MVATPQKYRNPRQGFYTDLYVDTTPVGAIVNNLKAGQNSFDHNYINANTNSHKHTETAGNAYVGGDDPAYTHEGYLYCNGDEHYITDYPGLFEIIGNKYGGTASVGLDITYEGQIKTFTHNGVYSSNRPTGTYLIQGITQTGSGTGAWFNVVVAGTSAPVVTLDNPGKGYAATDTIKLPNTKLGSIGGVADIIVTVSAIEGGGGSGYTVNDVVNIGAPAGVVWSNFLSPTVNIETSSGFSKNDGTVWSTNLTATSGFETANPATKAFDGSLTTFAQSTGTGTSANIEITGITTVYDPDSIQVYVEGGGSATDKWDISGTNLTTVETNASIGWQTVLSTGRVTDIKVTAKAAGQKAKLTAIRVNDTTLVDSQDDDSKKLGFDATVTAGRSESKGVFTFTPPTPIDLNSGDKLEVTDLAPGNTNTRSRVYATGPIIYSNYLSAGVDGNGGFTWDPNWVDGTAATTVGGTGPGGEHVVRDATLAFDSNIATPTGRTVGEFGLLLDLPVPIKLGVGDKVQVYDTDGTANTKSRAYYDTTWTAYTNHGTGWTTILTGSSSIQNIKKIYALNHAGGRDAGWMGIRIESAAGAITYFQDGTLPFNYSSTDYALGTRGAWVNHAGTSYTTIKTGSATVTKFIKLETERYDTELGTIFGTGVNAANNTWNIGSHECYTGDRVQYFNAPKMTGGNAQAGGPVSGLTNGQIYWVSKVDNNTIRFHTSEADALAVTNPVNLGANTNQKHGIRFLDYQAGVMGVRVQYQNGTNVPFIDGNLPPNPSSNNVLAQASIDAVDTNGKITAFRVTNFGKGYTSVPPVTITSSTGSGAKIVARINSTGNLQNITQANVMDYFGDTYLGTFKVPDMITKKVVGNGPVYGSNSPNIGNSALGVGTTGGKWYLDKSLQDNYFSLGRIVTSGYDNVTETVQCQVIGQHTVKFTMRETALAGPPQHSHTVYNTIPENTTQIVRASDDRYLKQYTSGRGKVRKWYPTDGGQKLSHKHGLVRRPNPDGTVATYDVLDAWGGAGSCGTIQNPEKFIQVLATNINTGADLINIVAHGLSTKAPIKYVQGAGGAIGGLIDGTTYYVIKEDDNNIKLALTAANAEASPVVAIDLTGTPSGTYEFVIDNPNANLNYLATGSGGTYQFQTTIPAPTFRKFVDASEIGGRRVLVSEGDPIVEYTGGTWEQTSGTGSSISLPANSTHIQYTIIGGGGGGASGEVAGTAGTASWLKLGDGSVLTLTAGGAGGGLAASATSGGQGGSKGLKSKSGSSSSTPPGGSDGIVGTAGTGERLMVGSPDNQTSDPNTGGLASSATPVANKGVGGNGINVKLGQENENVQINADSNGVIPLATTVGTATITALSFTIKGGEGATSANMVGHPGDPDAMPGGGGSILTTTMIDDPAIYANAKTKNWVVVAGGAGGAQGGHGDLRHQGVGIGSSAVSSQQGGLGGSGNTNGGSYAVNVVSSGGGGGASTRLEASGELVAGAGGGGGGGSHGHNASDVATSGQAPPTGATGYTALAVDAGTSGVASGCVGGGGGGGGAGIGPGNAGGSAGGSGDADGGGGPGGHAGGGGGQAGCSGWKTSWFNTGSVTRTHTGNGTGFATVTYDDSYWTAGGGSGGGGAVWGPQNLKLSDYGDPTSFQMSAGTGGNGGSIPAGGQGVPNNGKPGYVKVRAGIKVGETGATYRDTVGDIIESASKDIDTWDVEIVSNGTGVGNGAGTFKLPSTQVPIVIFRGGGLADGSANHAEANVTVTGGRVTGFNLTNAGSGYTEAPVIHIVHGAGGGAYATATIDAASGSINNIQFSDSNTYRLDSGNHKRFLKFGNHHNNSDTTDRNRWVVLKAQDTSNVDLFSIKCCRGNTKNGGDDSEEVLRVSYQKVGQTGWTLIDPIITPGTARQTDPILKAAKNSADRIVPVIDTTTTTGNYDGASGDTQWYTYSVTLPDDAKTTATKLKIEQPMPNPSGANDTDDDKQHFGICEFIFWRPKTSGLVFVPNAGAVSKPTVDELTYTIQGETGPNVTYSSGLTAGDATITLKRTTKIEPVASIDPDKHIPLIHTYKTCKYLIKAY